MNWRKHINKKVTQSQHYNITRVRCVCRSVALRTLWRHHSLTLFCPCKIVAVSSMHWFLVSFRRLRQNFVDGLLKGIPDIIKRIQVQAIQRPRVWHNNELHVLALQVTHCISGHVGRCGYFNLQDGTTLFFKTDSNKLFHIRMKYLGLHQIWYLYDQYLKSYKL